MDGRNGAHRGEGGRTRRRELGGRRARQGGSDDGGGGAVREGEGERARAVRLVDWCCRWVRVEQQSAAAALCVFDLFEPRLSLSPSRSSRWRVPAPCERARALAPWAAASHAELCKGCLSAVPLSRNRSPSFAHSVARPCTGPHSLTATSSYPARLTRGRFKRQLPAQPCSAGARFPAATQSRAAARAPTLGDRPSCSARTAQSKTAQRSPRKQNVQPEPPPVRETEQDNDVGAAGAPCGAQETSCRSSGTALRPPRVPQ